MALSKNLIFCLFALLIVSLAFARPQDSSAQDQEPTKATEKDDLKTANSYGFGYGYGFGYPYGYYGLYGLGYGYPYYGYYGAYGYPFYG